jgi:hypothetical protein
MPILLAPAPPIRWIFRRPAPALGAGFRAPDGSLATDCAGGLPGWLAALGTSTDS